MAVLWLALCVTAAVCLPPTRTEADAELPIKNLRMDPELRRLTWDLNGNVSKIQCRINSQSTIPAVNNSYCPFYVLPFCEVNNYTVSSTQEPWFSVGIRYPTPDGNPAAAAQRLGCLVHDVRFLTCSWQVGSEAPGDVQYRLFLQDLGTYQLEECPQYGVDARGTHVRCQFTNVSRLGGHVQVLVNGSSPSTRVPCSELTVEPGEIERLSLPKISGTCNQSYSTMEWKVFSYFHHRFRYELEIQKGSDPPYTEQLLQNSYVLPNPGTYVARLRAGKFFRTVWSEWSAPQRFDCDSGDDLHFRDWLTTALILLGALLTVGLGVVLCGRSLPPTDKRTLGPRCCPGTPSVLGSLDSELTALSPPRYSLLQKLFPPIPHMKDPISDNLQSSKLVTWEASRASREDCQVAEVQVLGET